MIHWFTDNEGFPHRSVQPVLPWLVIDSLAGWMAAGSVQGWRDLMLQHLARPGPVWLRYCVSQGVAMSGIANCPLVKRRLIFVF